MKLGASLFGTCMPGPVLAVTQTLAKVRMRAFAAALVALVVSLIGAGAGPAHGGSLERSACFFLSWDPAQFDMPCSYQRSLRCLERHSVSVAAHDVWRRSSSEHSSD
jgi:hypothetical protein